MNSKLLTGLAAAAVLLMGGPAFGNDDHKDRGGNSAPQHTASAPVSSGRYSDAANVRNGTGGRTFGARYAPTSGGYAANRSYPAAVRGNAYSSSEPRSGYRNSGRDSAAFGGNANYAHNGYSRGQYAFGSHDGWNHGHQYYWNGRHYGWYNDGWYVIDPYPYGDGYDTGYYSPGYGGGNVAVQVQAALAQAGYYQGPIDGIVGPGTSAALAAFQHDNGLRVTGSITPGVVQTLGIG
jgi:hypothetical protein